MLSHDPRRWPALCTSLLTVTAFINSAAGGLRRLTQEPFPDSPDLTRVYYQNPQHKLLPLPFESGASALNEFAVARRDKTTFATLEGLQAMITLKSDDPHFYVFVADKMDPPPHLLLRLESNRGRRQFTVISEKGRTGLAFLASQSIRLNYRILERLEVPSGKGLVLYINYLELRPRERLQPGEYAIVGNSLKDIATFRVE